MTRYLAIDPGAKRIGMAVADSATKIVTPLDVVESTARRHQMDMIEAVIQRYGPDELVIGMPFNMDGTEGPSARKARQWAREIQDRTGLPVHLADERLSTEAANEQMSRSGLTHRAKQQRRDGLAAAAILKEFLRTHLKTRKDVGQ